MYISPKNKVILLVLLAAVLVVPLFSHSVQGSAAVQIPEQLKLIIDGLVLAAVMLGLQAIFDLVGLDLRGMGAAIAAVLSAFVIAQLQGLIDVVPAIYDQWLTIGIQILVYLLSGVGVLRAIFHPQRAAALFAGNS